MKGDDRPQNAVAEEYCGRRRIAWFATIGLYLTVFVVTIAEISIGGINVNVKDLDDMYPGIGVLLWQNKLAGTDLNKLKAPEPPQWFKDCPMWKNTSNACIKHDFPLSYVTSYGKTLQFLGDDSNDPFRLKLDHYSIFAYYKTSKNYLDIITASYVALDSAGKCNIGENADAQMACGDVEVNAAMISPPDSCETCWDLHKHKRLDLDLCAHFFEGRRLQVVGFLIAQAVVIIVCLVLWNFSFSLYDKKGWKPKSPPATGGSNDYGRVSEQTHGAMGRPEKHPYLDFYYPAIFIFGAYVFGFSMRVWEFVPESKKYYECTNDALFNGIYFSNGAMFPVIHAILGVCIGVVLPLWECWSLYSKITTIEPQEETQDQT